MYYKKALRSEFKARNGLMVIGPATTISKLTATNYERISQANGPDKAKNTSCIIRKGPWRGKRIYVLTLEEGTTCPDSCPLNVPPPLPPARTREKGVACYGANMPFAVRMDHQSSDFEKCLIQDLSLLATRHPDGFVIRLHELGDFFSVEYVEFWRSMLDSFENLHIFGYSHCNGAIGKALDNLQFDHPDRFRIMTSDDTVLSDVRPSARVSGETIKHYVTCPQQEKRTPSCITCGLCMNGRTHIRFLPH